MHGPPPTVDHDLVEYYATRYVRSNMRCLVKIGRIRELEQDDEYDAVIHPIYAEVVYAGQARIYSTSGPQNIDSSEESAVFATSNITTPMVNQDGSLVLTQANDIIEVVSNPDPLIQGRFFRILDVEAGGQWPHSRRHMVVGAERYEGWTWIENA